MGSGRGQRAVGDNGDGRSWGVVLTRRAHDSLYLSFYMNACELFGR